MPRVKVTWSPTALSHFSGWIRYIAKDSMTRAEGERQRLLKATARLQKFPGSGRTVPEFGNPSLREIILKPIRIIYRLRKNEVRILTFHHARRELDHLIFA